MKRIYITILILQLCCAVIEAGLTNSHDSDTLLTAGNVKLNFNIIKGSKINILLESGGGDDLTVWAKIAPAVAAKTGATVICYDRPGFGKSGLPDEPHSIKKESEWLWKCLKHLGLNKNLILAGHSFGGWMIRMTASLHPEEIKGILFIDPFSNEIVELLSAEKIDALQKGGYYKELGVKTDEEYANLISDQNRVKSLSRAQRSFIRFWGKTGTLEKYNEMKNTVIPGNIPVKVITSGKQWLPDDIMKAWRASHERLAASVPNSELVIAKESQHYIIFNEPDLVINKLAEIAEIVK